MISDSCIGPLFLQILRLTKQYNTFQCFQIYHDLRNVYIQLLLHIRFLNSTTSANNNLKVVVAFPLSPLSKQPSTNFSSSQYCIFNNSSPDLQVPVVDAPLCISILQ